MALKQPNHHFLRKHCTSKCRCSRFKQTAIKRYFCRGGYSSLVLYSATTVETNNSKSNTDKTFLWCVPSYVGFAWISWHLENSSFSRRFSIEFLWKIPTCRERANHLLISWDGWITFKFTSFHNLSFTMHFSLIQTWLLFGLNRTRKKKAMLFAISILVHQPSIAHKMESTVSIVNHYSIGKWTTDCGHFEPPRTEGKTETLNRLREIKSRSK